MEQSNPSKAALISGIEADANQESEKLIADAEKQAAEKRKYAAKKRDSLMVDAKKRGQEQADAIKRKVISGVELEIKRRSLRIRDTVMQDIMTRVEEQLKTRIDTPEYRRYLRDWIVEAACGLDVETAQLNASSAERELIDEALLREVIEQVNQKAGKSINVTLSADAPLEGQGVVLTSADGRMAFNNQVRTRMLRHRHKIQMMIYEALFAEKDHSS